MADSPDARGSPAGHSPHSNAPTASHGPRRPHRKNKQHGQSDGFTSEPASSGSPRNRNNAYHQHNTQPIHLNHKAGHHGQRQRPPSIGSQMTPATPAKEQAYAGPTFQASPAASALPVPKFFSRSVPGATPLLDRLDAEHSPGPHRFSPGSDAPLPAPPSPAEKRESPLDMFFLADKAEKERTRSGVNSLSPDQRVPPRLAMSPTNGAFSHQNSFKSAARPDEDNNQTDHLNSNSPINRPRLPQRFHSSDQAIPQPHPGDAQRDAYTKSLKDLLFNNFPSRYDEPLPRTQPRLPSQAQQGLHTPSPVQQPSSGPNSPTATSEQRSNYALHYGNRNLSQLFQAARDEIPPRPSGLRQEVRRDHPAPQRFSANEMSRNYLNQHIHGARDTHFPQSTTVQHGSSEPGIVPHPPASAPPSSTANSRAGVDSIGTHSATGSTPRAGHPDIRTMEDDLRKMLKLNVVS